MLQRAPLELEDAEGAQLPVQKGGLTLKTTEPL